MDLNHPLHWEPACDADSARLGADGSLLLDYLLHPPVNTPPPAQDLPEPHCRDRQCALEALIDTAFTR